MRSEVPESGMPKITALLLTTPLYEEIELGEKYDSYLSELRLNNFNIDGYCPECRSQTTYQHRVSNSISGRSGNLSFRLGSSSDGMLDNFRFNESITCSRSSRHFVEVYFLLNGTVLQKIGQTPTIADLQFGIFKKYEKVLGKEYHSELTKAIGLKSHGIGIGSFVYLRRIFEKLIEEAYKHAKLISGWDESAYIRSRMADKVEMLKQYLPETLVEHKQVYSYLSLGIHELTENQCLEIHEIMLTSIEIILDEKEEARLKKEKNEELKKKLGSIKITSGK